MLSNSAELTAPTKRAKPSISNRSIAFMRLVWSYRFSYLFIAPFALCFIAFILVPILLAFLLSFTSYNAIEPPRFIGWKNFQYLLSQDIIFLKHSIPNTFKFALLVGPGGFVAAFVLAWLIAQLPSKARTWYALAFYTPSLAGAAMMGVVWIPLLAGDRLGYLNSFLLEIGFINKPILWVLDKAYLMNSMIGVTLWANMGIGFLAMLAGILNVNKELYEAGKIDGISSRLQEIWYITIPSMKPQMLFSAVLAIVSAFGSGGIGQTLSGVFPTPQYSGHVIVSTIQDYGSVRMELGYSTSVSVFLLVVMYVANRFVFRLFGSKGE